jgi:hypothetical protein
VRPRNERSRPRAEGDPDDNHTDNVILAEPCDTAREIYARRRWERHWSRAPIDGWRIALATAAVDNVDRRVPGPLSISFAQARALAAIHGVFCACHPVPAPPSIRQSRGAA